MTAPSGQAPVTAHLESAAKFNPIFIHRVRITAATDLYEELRGWLAIAYALAGSPLDNLQRKGWLRRQQDGRAYRYEPAVSGRSTVPG